MHPVHPSSQAPASLPSVVTHPGPVNSVAAAVQGAGLPPLGAVAATFSFQNEDPLDSPRGSEAGVGAAYSDTSSETSSDYSAAELGAAWDDEELAEAKDVGLLMKTAKGTRILLDEELVKKHQGDLDQSFQRLKAAWKTGMEAVHGAVDSDFRVEICDFNLGLRTVRYRDQNGEWHVADLVKDLEDLIASGGVPIGETEEHLKEVLEDINTNFTALQSVVKKVWGGSKDSELVFVTDVRSGPTVARAFSRSGGYAESYLLTAKKRERDAISPVLDKVAKGYKTYLTDQGLPEDEVNQELDAAFKRMRAAELLLKDLEERLSEKHTQLVDQHKDLSDQLNGAKTPPAQSPAVIADLEKDLQECLQNREALQLELQRCAQVDRLALYTAAAFASPDGSAKQQAEAAFRFMRGYTEETHQALVQEARSNETLFDRFKSRLSGTSVAEKIEIQHDKNTPYAIEVGSLVLQRLNSAEQKTAYYSFIGEKGAQFTRSSLEGSLLSWLLSPSGKDKTISSLLSRMEPLSVDSDSIQTEMQDPSIPLVAVPAGPFASLEERRNAVLDVICPQPVVPAASAATPPAAQLTSPPLATTAPATLATPSVVPQSVTPVGGAAAATGALVPGHPATGPLPAAAPTAGRWLGDRFIRTLASRTWQAIPRWFSTATQPPVAPAQPPVTTASSNSGALTTTGVTPPASPPSVSGGMLGAAYKVARAGFRFFSGNW